MLAVADDDRPQPLGLGITGHERPECVPALPGGPQLQRRPAGDDRARDAELVVDPLHEPDPGVRQRRVVRPVAGDPEPARGHIDLFGIPCVAVAVGSGHDVVEVGGAQLDTHGRPPRERLALIAEHFGVVARRDQILGHVPSVVEAPVQLQHHALRACHLHLGRRDVRLDELVEDRTHLVGGRATLQDDGGVDLRRIIERDVIVPVRARDCVGHARQGAQAVLQTLWRWRRATGQSDEQRDDEDRHGSGEHEFRVGPRSRRPRPSGYSVRRRPRRPRHSARASRPRRPGPRRLRTSSPRRRRTPPGHGAPARPGCGRRRWA